MLIYTSKKLCKFLNATVQQVLIELSTNLDNSLDTLEATYVGAGICGGGAHKDAITKEILKETDLVLEELLRKIKEEISGAWIVDALATNEYKIYYKKIFQKAQENFEKNGLASDTTRESFLERLIAIEENFLMRLNSEQKHKWREKITMALKAVASILFGAFVYKVIDLTLEMYTSKRSVSIMSENIKESDEIW